MNYFEVDYSRAFTHSLTQPQIIVFSNNQDYQSIFVFNSLTSTVRHDIITLVIATENVKVNLVI